MQRDQKYTSTDIDNYLKRSLLDIKASEVNPTNISALSLNGGGQKGLIYSGMLRALEETSFTDSSASVLSHIKHLTGSSAGAITASLLAVGITPDELSAITSVPFTRFTDSIIKIKSDSTTLKTFLNIIYLYKLWLKNPTNTKVSSIFPIDTANPDFFESTNLINLATLIKEQPQLFYHFPTFNFEDLQHVSNKTLDITVTDTKTASTIVYNETQPETPLAEAVILSASHPILFKQQEGFTDGGASDNMPLIPLIKRGLSLPNIITVSLNEGYKTQKSHHKLHSQPAHLSAPIQRLVVGANVTKAREQSSKTKGITSAIENNLELFSGEIKTTSMEVDCKELKNRNVDSYNETIEFLKKRFQSHSERTELLLNLSNVSQEIKAIIQTSSAYHQKLNDIKDSKLNKNNLRKTSKQSNNTKNLIKAQLISIIKKTLSKDFSTLIKEPVYNVDHKSSLFENSSNTLTRQEKKDTTRFSLENQSLQELEEAGYFAVPEDPHEIPVDTDNSYYFESFVDPIENPSSQYSATPVDSASLIDIHTEMLSRPQRRDNIEQEQTQTILKIFDIIRNVANIDDIVTKEDVFNIQAQMKEQLNEDNSTPFQQRF
jgi:predicted acylesterase/phospholipase RssA